MARASLSMAILLASAAIAGAQNLDDPEAMAAIKQGEIGRLERDTIGSYGDLTRFDVSVLWDSTAAARPEGYMPRRLRYVADCKARTLVLGAVSVFDASGRLMKTMILPPGAVDPAAPAEGSVESKWLREVCRL